MPGPDTQTVTVACKLPHGLVLRLYNMIDWDEPQAGGGFKTVKRAQAIPGEVRVRGYLEKYRVATPPAAQGSSYVLTPGVSKQFWDEWLKQNADHPAVVNRLIFASEKQDTVSGKVRENRDTRSGLEPIDPEKLPKNISTYKRDDQAAA